MLSYNTTDAGIMWKRLTGKYSAEYVDAVREIYKALYYNDGGSWYSFGTATNFSMRDVQNVMDTYSTQQIQSKVPTFNPNNANYVVPIVSNWAGYTEIFTERILTQLYWYVQDGTVHQRFIDPQSWAFTQAERDYDSVKRITEAANPNRALKWYEQLDRAAQNIVLGAVIGAGALTGLYVYTTFIKK